MTANKIINKMSIAANTKAATTQHQTMDHQQKLSTMDNDSNKNIIDRKIK